MIYTVEAWSHNPASFNSDLLSNADIHALIYSDELEEQLPFEIVMVRWNRSDSQVRHGTRVTREYTVPSYERNHRSCVFTVAWVDWVIIGSRLARDWKLSNHRSQVHVWTRLDRIQSPTSIHGLLFAWVNQVIIDSRLVRDWGNHQIPQYLFDKMVIGV